MRGKILGDRYRIQNKIGEGGMANIYVAYDEKLSRKVAIKFLHKHMSGNQDIRKRFFHEAQAISSLNHPNILKVYDFSGEHSEDVWMVTEVLLGLNLSEYTKSFPGNWLHPIIAAMICREILKALNAAHSGGIIHRDIKPENIFVLNSGGIRLMDFGIAKNNRVQSMTMTGTFMGSPSYMSPEQIRGKSIDARSDIYSLGVLFYEIITSKLPYVGTTTHDIVLKICEGRFRPPIHHIPNLPSDLNKMICRAMAKHPMHRYQEARTFAKDIDIFLAKHHFEESHIELERYFIDRDKFEARLRRLDFTNKATVAVNFGKKKSEQAKAEKTKTHHTRMLSNQEQSSAIRSQNQNSLNTPVRNLINHPAQQPQPAAQSMGKRRDRAINILPPKIANQRSYRQETAIHQPHNKKHNRPRVPHRQPSAKLYSKHVTYASKPNDSLTLVVGFLLVMMLLTLSVIGFYYFHINLSPTTQRISEERLQNIRVKQIPRIQSENQSKNTTKKRPSKKPTPRKVIKRPTPTRQPRPQPIYKKYPYPQKESVDNTQKSTPVTPTQRTPVTTRPPVKKDPPRVVNKPAYFRISSQPAAEIYVDGKRVGTTIDKTTSSGWVKVLAGSRTIELRRTGYRTYSRTLKLNPGQRSSAPMITLRKGR